MPKAAPRHELAGFTEIIKREEPLAPYTYLKVGGPAEMLVQPCTRVELAGVIASLRASPSGAFARGESVDPRWVAWVMAPAEIPDYEIAPGSDLTYSGNPRAPHHLTLTW